MWTLKWRFEKQKELKPFETSTESELMNYVLNHSINKWNRDDNCYETKINKVDVSILYRLKIGLIEVLFSSFRDEDLIMSIDENSVAFDPLLSLKDAVDRQYKDWEKAKYRGLCYDALKEIQNV